MAEARHGKLTTAEGIHRPMQWSYADAAARTGATGFVVADVGKLALQEDDNSLWLLTATTPTWIFTGGGTGSHIDHGTLTGLGDDDHSQYLLATGARVGSSDQAQDFGATGIKAGVIAESVGDAGVTVDGVLIKDGNVDGADVSALASASHAAVTLDANADAIFGLTAQQFNLDTQAANTVFAGPVSGAAAVPAFRALVETDLGTLVSAVYAKIDQTTPNTLLGTWTLPIVHTPTINGGILADGDITIQGTTHATRTSSYVLLQPNGGNVGIGTTSPGEKLTLAATTTANLRIDGGTAADLYIDRGANTNYSRLMFQTAGTTEFTVGNRGESNGHLYIYSAANAKSVTIESSTPASTLYLNSSGNVGIGTTGPDRLFHAEVSDAGTSAVIYAQRLSHITSGTAAAGFGTGSEFELEDGGGTNRVTGGIESLWNDPATGSYKADLILKAADSGGAREGLRIRGTGSAAAIAFLGATPSARLAHIADAKADYAAGDLDTEAEIIAAINALATTLNTALVTSESFGLRATS